MPAPLFVDDGGASGPPVVLLHAAGGASDQWAAQLRHLRRSRRAVAVDLRGHGRSPAPAGGALPVEALAADVVATLDALGLRRVVLVGHSLGGAVAVALAGAHPERVAGLFLLDPASDGRDLPPAEAAGLLAALRSDAYPEIVEAHWRSMLQPSTPAVRERVLRDLRATRREAVVGTLEALLRFDPVPALTRYRGPRLSVITPQNDVPGAYHRLAPDLPLRRIDGTGHWVQLDAPEVVNAALDAFLAGLPEGP
jgi:pimeloyl-ACP methyl ester carboxylesterase